MTRPHGTKAKYVVEGCRCEPCRQACRDYERWRRRQIAYGRTPYVDAEPVRAHLHALSRQGLGWMRAARLAGVPESTVCRLLYGGGARGPSKRVRRRTAAALLAVTAELEHLGATVHVPAAGPRRRLQALVALGWPQAQIARRMGVNPANLGKTLHGTTDRVNASTARAARTLYDELWDRSPARPDGRALAAARRHGWVPPLAWDDDTIDDPAARPAHDLTYHQWWRSQQRAAA